ncbi:hypothetical protein [Mucilaginibacter agri]|uniref:Uncharacterized protein n=1 Tax=Mucilaginibacter agri TaxID=2695265 RepID=A0A965ZD31_9SPHI|nr:hypothetical protein [Mucilaginibacter agri]NCD68809.1 hypothetical protein [Mucilaginibacter agri]
MKDTFDLYRFTLLFKKTILERPAQLLGLMALMLLVSLGFYSFFAYFREWEAAHATAFIWGYVGGGIVLASVIFAHFTTNASGAAYLMLPASSLEKWLCGISIVGVMFTIIFLGFYRLMDFSFINLYHSRLNKNDAHYQFFYSQAQIFAFDGRLPKFSYMLFANFAGAALLGSLYYNRAGLVKTALTVLATMAFIGLANYLIARLFFNNLSSANPFWSVNLQLTNNYRTVDAPQYIKDFADNLTQFIIPAILWVTVYIRLREKEI